MYRKNFQEIALLFLHEKAKYVKKSTITIYHFTVQKHLISYFGGHHQISEKAVQKFILWKNQQGLKTKTIKDLLVLLKMILKFGTKNYNWVVPEMELAFPVSQHISKIKILSLPEHKKLMVYLKKNFNFRNFGLMLVLSSGIRIGEICALKWQNFDLKQAIFKIRQTCQRIMLITPSEGAKTELILDAVKTQSSLRDLPLSAFLTKILKPLQKILNPEYFVISNDYKPIEPRVYRNYYQKILRLLKLPILTFHGLRHSFATRLVETRTDYKIISSLLGHRSIKTTLDLYVHPDFTQKKKSLEKMLKQL